MHIDIFKTAPIDYIGVYQKSIMMKKVDSNLKVIIVLVMTYLIYKYFIK